MPFLRKSSQKNFKNAFIKSKKGKTMIDTKLLLNDFEATVKKLQSRDVSKSQLQNLANLTKDYKEKKQVLESCQESHNKESKHFGMLMAQKRDKNDSEVLALKAKLESNKTQIATNEAFLKEAKEQLDFALAQIPNIPDCATPEGKDESENVEINRFLNPKDFSFTPKEHWELADKNKWIDFSAGVKLAKSRFSVLRGQGARLSRALINFMLDMNEKAGFEIVATPVIVNETMLFGTGQLPKFEADMFKIATDKQWENDDFSKAEDFSKDCKAKSSKDKNDCAIDSKKTIESIDSKDSKNALYLISTSEITLTNLYNDSIINAEDLPICLTAQTPCFRKEAGSAGRDTRGIIRQHQFDKVELVAITHPSQSEAMQAKMLQCASNILTALGLPHRFMQLCSGDLGFSASNTVDIEVWFAGQGRYREISSVSNTRDFQARRAKIRYKENGKNNLVHTLNGSSLAVGRTLAAIMEYYQKENGEIEIPKVLEPYMAQNVLCKA